MAEFGNRKLPGNLPPSPTSHGALCAFSKQRRVWGGWASGDYTLPGLMQASDREKTGGGIRVRKKEESDMSLGSIQNLVIHLTSNP